MGSDVYKAYEKRLRKISGYAGFASLIFTVIAGVLLLLVSWQWWMIIQLLGISLAFLFLAYRDERESVYHWYFLICFLFGGLFSIALVAQLIYLFTG